jgi:release factor glutamine methyltransferase
MGALACAAANASRHGLDDRIEFRQGDFLDPIRESCGLIVSNPPYVASREIERLKAEVRDHDPKLALDGGPDGLDAYRALAAGAPARLLPGGALAVEIGSDQASAVIQLFSCRGLVEEAVTPDIAGRDRVVVARKPGFRPSLFVESPR